MKTNSTGLIKKISKAVYIPLFAIAIGGFLFGDFLISLAIWSAGLAVQSVPMFVEAGNEDGGRQAYLLRFAMSVVAAAVLGAWNELSFSYDVRFNIVVFCYAAIILSNCYDSVNCFTEALIAAVKGK